MYPTFGKSKSTVEKGQLWTTPVSNALSRSVPNCGGQLTKAHENYLNYLAVINRAPGSDGTSKEDMGVRKCASIFDSCDRPQCDQRRTHVDMQDCGLQVNPGDIQPARSTQTSPSLLRRSSSLPKRYIQRIKTIEAHKCREMRDCEMTCPCADRELVSSETQTEPWQVLDLDIAQTGPSLTAVGDFCRYDYKLKKTTPFKVDPFFDCRRAEEHEVVICSRSRCACFDFYQQVCPLDINVSEHTQTEKAMGYTQEYEQIIHGRRHKEVPTVIYKATSLLNCECPRRGTATTYKQTKDVTMQVTPTDICPAQLVQTDLCLLVNLCTQCRLYPNVEWGHECDGSHGFPSPKEVETVNSLSQTAKDFSQQVKATDICDTVETQTCFPANGPSASALACQKSKTMVDKHVFTGGSATFSPDVCFCCCLASGLSCAFHGGTRVTQNVVTACEEAQTRDQVTQLSKWFVRGQEWSSKAGQ